jgi:hypothetical protein
MADLDKEVWISDIEENLYADNQFMTMIGKSDDDYVDNKTVHLPQSGAKPTVVKNRSTLPAPVETKVDSVLSYSMDWYTVNPVVIPDNELQFISYDKRMDVIGDEVKTLGDTIANQTLYKWAAGTTIKTTGAAVDGAHAPGATGTRLVLTRADLNKANAILDKQNLKKGERYLVIPSDMYWLDLLGISEFVKYLEFGREVLPSGVIGNVLGMNVIMRSSVVVYDNAGTPALKTIGDNGEVTTTATTDNLGAMVIQSPYVRKAKGAVKLYFQEDAPEYFGSLMSGGIFHGASKARTDGKGIVQIVQAN